VVKDEATTIDIKTLSQSYAGLLLTHSELLQRKNVRSKQRLLQIIKLDLNKLTQALLEVKERRAWPILTHFFAGHKTLLSAIAGRLEQNVIDHIGFEIHEPLDLVLHGLEHWLTKTRRTFQCRLAIQDFLCFPASTAFQQRVGGYTEIMRLWVQVNGQTLMLELFDIHRPVDEFLAGGRPQPLRHRNFDCLVTPTGIKDKDIAQAESLFQGDEIWHYAFRVRSFADVWQLHEELQTLAVGDPTYRLPYAAPVHNAGDGSLHTKIIHQAADLELEFIALSPQRALKVYC
jgi:hypothetical protein